MAKKSFVVISKFTDITEAKVVQSKLESCGIESWLDDQNIANMNWFYTNLIGGLRLRVRTEDAEDAMVILKDIVVEELENYEKPKNNSKKNVIWITIILFGIVPFLLLFLQKC